MIILTFFSFAYYRIMLVAWLSNLKNQTSSSFYKKCFTWNIFWTFIESLKFVDARLVAEILQQRLITSCGLLSAKISSSFNIMNKLFTISFMQSLSVKHCADIDNIKCFTWNIWSLTNKYALLFDYCVFQYINKIYSFCSSMYYIFGYIC